MLSTESAVVANFTSNAQYLLTAARTLLPALENGQIIDAKTLRAAMEDSYGCSDTTGRWSWKDAYETVECAQILMLLKYGTLMQRKAETPAVCSRPNSRCGCRNSLGQCWHKGRR